MVGGLQIGAAMRLRFLLPLLVLVAVLVGGVVATGCVATADDTPDAAEPGADEPSVDEMEMLDAWADASGGKADLPGSYSALVAWVKDFYKNRLSAVWGSQEHPASASAAIARVRGLLTAQGIDPDAALFEASVQRLRFSTVADHSEVDVVLPTRQVVRLIGDPKGAGVFLDSKLFADALSPPLCLTWSELQTAITASYVAGHYALDFVCHNVTERVLRALDIGSARFSSQIHAYSIARWTWGPILPSGNSSDPARWAESRSCH